MLVLAAGLYGTPAFPVDKQASGGAAAEPQSESLWNRGTLTGSWAGVRTQLETAGIKLSVQEQSLADRRPRQDMGMDWHDVFR
jgi:hypothetical protein